MKVGYARVSSKEQNLDRQIESLHNAGCEKIYCDKMSGKDFNRPEYQRMLTEIGEGDVVYLHSLDRLGRDYDMIIEEWKNITRKQKADIIVLDMPLLDTTAGRDLTGKFISDLVLQILSYVAETERRNIKKRQAEGIAIAKAKGIYKGRPKEIDYSKLVDLKDIYNRGDITITEFAKQLGVSRGTIYRRLKEAK